MENKIIREKLRAPRNRTIAIDQSEMSRLNKKLIVLEGKAEIAYLTNKTICQDTFKCLEVIPDGFVDLLFVDPPYNMNKDFNSIVFKEISSDAYELWLDSWLNPMRKILKPTASIYVCGDWRSTSAIYRVLSRYFNVRNRITWEREKGRGAKSNWKNCSEDIWFATVGDKYIFNADAVRLKRKVIAPYRDTSGLPKDWEETETGNFRLTSPSNLWTDLTIPYWSMRENTDHPTQKPEKLLAKIILASTNPGNLVFDPFLGSGTTSTVAKKLGRQYCGVEMDNFYACLAEKRLEMADLDRTIQGYVDGVFWERNSLSDQKIGNGRGRKADVLKEGSLFDMAKA